jgi:hypothetical protein
MLRSEAWTEVTSKRLPSAVRMLMGRASPMTWKLVAMSPSAATTNDDEASAAALGRAVAAGALNHHDRLADRLGELLDRFGSGRSGVVSRGGLFLVSAEQRGRDKQQTERSGPNRRQHGAELLGWGVGWFA